MINLLSANLFHLRKSLLFWVTLGLCAAAGAWQPIQTFLEFERYIPLDNVFFTYAMLNGLLLAVFLPLFFGTEYSDGTIRNKLAAGHARPSVYLANLITAILTAFLFCGVYILFTLAVGIPLLGAPKYSKLLFTTTLLSLLAAAAWCALYTLINMNLSRKAGAAVSCILLYLALFLGAMITFSKLDAPEFYPAYTLTVDGEMDTVMERTPHYLQPEERWLYEFLLDLNPMGQSVQYIDLTPDRPVRLVLCSLGIIAVTTAAGTALFRRKDLK